MKILLKLCVKSEKILYMGQKYVKIRDMKIERLNENQIRCTLYKADLADKELLLSELAYGTEKAKELFRDLMERASEELGFEADNVPLMIEAIPVNRECLVLIITKVEDPDELDGRFSRFTNFDEDAYDEDEDEDGSGNLLDASRRAQTDIENMKNLLRHLGVDFNKLKDMGKNQESTSGNVIKADQEPAKAEKVASAEVFRIYAFKNLDQVIMPARMVNHVYKSINSLYKNPKDSRFYLYMTKDKNTEAEFVQVCNIMGEYGMKQSGSYASQAHMEEHYKLILAGDAVAKLAEL